MTTHALLSASRVARATRCPGSVHAARAARPVAGDDAAEGQEAHAVAAAALTDFDALGARDRVAAAASAYSIEASRRRDLIDAVTIYVAHVIELLETAGVTCDVERPLTALPRLHPALGGTPDAVVYNAVGRTLDVVDYKHGAGIRVEAFGNVQLLTYAVGAWLGRGTPDLDRVTLTVVQPRVPGDPIREWSVSTDDLWDHAATLVDLAEAVSDPRAPRVPGPHCQLCDAAATCDALYAAATDPAPPDETLRWLEQADARDIARRLEQADTAEIWIRTLRKHALSEALAGRPPRGWKAVHAKGRRAWADPEAAVRDVASHVVDLRPQDLYHPAEPFSPAQVEAHVGRAALRRVVDRSRGSDVTLADAIARHVHHVSGGPTLVPETDKRPVYQSVSDDSGVDVDLSVT